MLSNIVCFLRQSYLWERFPIGQTVPAPPCQTAQLKQRHLLTSTDFFVCFFLVIGFKGFDFFLLQCFTLQFYQCHTTLNFNLRHIILK